MPYVANPAGYPTWFNYDPSLSGFSSVNNDVAKFSVIGSALTVELHFDGTSNATTLSAQAPLARVSYSETPGYPAIVENNGTDVAAVATVGFNSNQQIDFHTAANFAGGAN